MSNNQKAVKIEPSDSKNVIRVAILRLTHKVFIIFQTISATLNKTLTPAVINCDSAQYYFEDINNIIPEETITFPVEFVKENGVWKILEF